MIAEVFFAIMVALFGIGAVTPLVLRGNEDWRNYGAHTLAALGSLSAMLCAVFVFLQGEVSVHLFTWERLGNAGLRLDYLGAWFLLLMGLIGLAASVYGMGYCREYYEHRLGILTAGLNIFLLSMALVFTVDHVVAFLVVWELMTLASFVLVNVEWERTDNRRAAYLYLTMTQVGTAFLMSALLIMASAAGSFEFAVLSKAELSNTMVGAVFILAFIGLATKAGLFPLHIWLPEAHPAAPSHVSALMSGVMIKSAVYGFSRVVLEFLPGLPAWCGGLVLLVAVVTCIIAALLALMETDVKKMLAYSSIENMGIIFLGLGAGMVFLAHNMSAAAGLAWLAVLMHVFNHGIFKGLLFLSAGAVIQGSHCKDMEKMGGLIRLMPWTALVFIIAGAAISALPPLNGFVSEWLVYQSLFALPQAVPSMFSKAGGALLIAALGLTGALAAACFVRAIGIIFLAKPRSEAAKSAAECPTVMLVPMFGLATMCVAAGVFPQVLLTSAMKISENFLLLSGSGVAIDIWGTMLVEVSRKESAVSLPLVVLMLCVGLAVALAAVRLGGKCVTTVKETWTCGIVPNARMEYTATGFAKPIRVAFGTILRFKRERNVNTELNQYHGAEINYNISIERVVIKRIYDPVNDLIIKSARSMRKLQNGSLSRYIGYIMAVTVLALIWSTR